MIERVDESQDTRTRILQATWKLLVDQEGSGGRMGDIAKQAGISRQAVYLHFATRAELLAATTQYMDEALDVDKRLEPSRTSKTGVERLEYFIEAWGNYIPEIYGVAKALMAAENTDEAAAAAWKGRMLAMREGCKAAIDALNKDGALTPEIKPKQATDLLWTMLSVRNWENLTVEAGWSQRKYLEHIKLLTSRAFVK